MSEQTLTYLTTAQIVALYAMRKAAPALAVRTTEDRRLVVIAPDLRTWWINELGATVAQENELGDRWNR